MAMATSPPTSLNRADLDATLARVSSKPNVSGALVIAKDTGAIIRSTLADNDLAKKYSLGVKRILRVATELIVELLQCSKQITKDIDAEDDLRLLRLRSKKYELLIVPDKEYLLVVIHDTPPS